MAMLEAVSSVIATESDCAGRATALRAWAEREQALIQRVKEELHRWPPPEIQAAVEQQMPQHPNIQAMFQTAQACQSEPAFLQAWKAVGDAME